MTSQFHKFLKKKLDQKHNHSSSSSSRRRRPFNCRNDDSNPMSQVHYNDTTSSNSFDASSRNNDYDSNMSNTGSNFSQSTKGTNNKQRKKWMGMLNSDKSNDSLDLKILDTEAKIQSQIRQLAIETLDEKGGSNRGNNGKNKPKLMTSAGVLLFDGLGTFVIRKP